MQPRRSFRAFLLTAASVVLAACGSAGPSPSIAASPAASATATSPTGPAPADILGNALRPILAASSFETTITVDGAVVATSAGRTVGSSSHLTVTRGTQEIEYVQIPPKAWARDAGGAWVLLTADKAPGDPVAILAAPTEVSLAATVKPGEVDLVATYPAASLGLTGDTVTVDVAIAGDTVTFRYDTTANGAEASSVTVIKPGATTPAIAAPKA